MKKKITILLILVSPLIYQSCGNLSAGGGDFYNEVSRKTKEYKAYPIIDWMELLYYHIANERLSPPEASRIYAYVGAAIYEAVVPGMPGYNSLAGQVNELNDVPRPDKNQKYNWEVAMIESLYRTINVLLERHLTAGIKTMSNLREQQLNVIRETEDEEVIERSIEFGKQVASAITAWSETDGYEDTRLLQYKSPPRDKNPGFWEPTDNDQVELEPFWNRLRPFVLESPYDCGLIMDESIEFNPEYTGDVSKVSGTIPSQMPPFSTEPGTDFWKEADSVYQYDKGLTEEERIIALFWADDPGETSTPPGHWIYIMNNMVKSLDMDLERAAEMYAMVGVSIADAFIVVWDTKYLVNLVRPKTYIREYFGEPGWEPYVETPPFPEYASGHSGVSGSAATILTHLLGDQPFVDSTHIIIGLEPRSFNSFWDAAVEAANSRMYGGIHYSFAIEDALEQGKCVAEKVMEEVKLRKDEKIGMNIDQQHQ